MYACVCSPALQFVAQEAHHSTVLCLLLDYQIIHVCLLHPRTSLFFLGVFLIKYCLRTYSRRFFSFSQICLQLFSFCSSKLSEANLIVSFVCHPFSQLNNLNCRLLKNLPSHSERRNLYLLKKGRKITAWLSSSMVGYQSK